MPANDLARLSGRTSMPTVRNKTLNVAMDAIRPQHLRAPIPHGHRDTGHGLNQVPRNCDRSQSTAARMPDSLADEGKRHLHALDYTAFQCLARKIGTNHPIEHPGPAGLPHRSMITVDVTSLLI